MKSNKAYEINIDVDLYKKIINTLNDVKSSLEGDMGKAKVNPFSGELLTYYESLESDVASKFQSIIDEIDELSLKIDTSINTYQNIDEELRFGLDSIVDKIFEVGNESGISEEFDGLSTYQERKEYLEKLIKGYETTLEELKKEYNNLYGNGIVIEYHEQFQNWFTIVTSLGGVNNFNSGLGNIYNQNGNLDIDNLSIILNFYKENNLNVKLKNYIIDGKSWNDSGLSYFNDNELTDNENEFNFLYSIYDSFGISSNEYVENIFFDGYDSYNEKNINTAKSFLSQKMDFNLFGKLNETYTDCITKQADIINLQSAIYNYEQYQKLMPFEEARRNIDYLDYIGKDYSNYDNDILNGSMYGGKYKDYLGYMDQSEVALYDYIYTKQGSDIAETYLFALTDTINQRKGFEKALNYVSGLNKNGLDAGDFFVSGWEGFKDGNITFFNGISNFFNADGIVSDFDYEMLYKMQLLSSDEYMKQLLSNDEYKNYTDNLSEEAKKFLSYNYQINNSIGNMTIPMLVSFVPVVGKSASSALMWTSSTGNATEQAMQGGSSKATAYLYGGLSGLSEVAFEKVMGGIPGLSDGVGVGFKGIFKDMISEGNEEYLQTWIDALLRATILGEKIDVSSVSGEAMESFGMGMAVSGQMKVGMAGPAKIIDVGVKHATNGVFSDYNSYKLNAELGNNGIDVTEAINNNTELPNLPNLQNAMFDPESNRYRAQFSDGKIRFADDVSGLSNSSLKTFNTSLSNVVTDEEVINKSSINETVVNQANDSSTSPNNFFNFTFNFNSVQEKIKNTTGAILTKVGEVGNLLKGFVLNTAMAEEDIDDINTKETIINTNTENNTTNLSKPTINFKFDFVGIKEKIKNTTGVILTKVGELGNLLKGFVLRNNVATQDNLKNNIVLNNMTEINNILSTILPANYYHSDITISKMFNKVYYNIPIIYSESSVDYSIIELYPSKYYIRVSVDDGNIEQQIKTQLESIVSKNTKINESIEQANTVDDMINEELVIKTSNEGLSEFPIDEKQDNVTIEQNNTELIDVESLLKKVRINPYSLKDISEKILMKHPEIVLEAIKPHQSGLSIDLINIKKVIKCVSENVLLAHPEIVREALNQEHTLIANLSEKVQSAHSDIILDFIKQYNGMIRYVNEEVLLNHREIVEESLKTYSSVLSGISEKVQLKYADLVMDVVKKDPKALAYVSEEVKHVHSQKLIEIVKESYGNNIIGILLQASLTKDVDVALNLLHKVEAFFKKQEVWKSNLELSNEVALLYSNVKSKLISKQFSGSTVFNGIEFKLYGENKNILAHNANKVRKVLEVLPDYLKKYFPSNVNIYDSENPDDLYWTVKYNWKTRFISAATGGGDTINVYESAYSGLASVLVHEIGHLVDDKNGRLSETNIWTNAVEGDFGISGKRNVTDYGECSIREDFADSVKLYWQEGDAFRKKFPNRANVLDDILLK